MSSRRATLHATPSGGHIVYPHTGVAILSIVQIWVICGIMIGAILWASHTVLPKSLVFPANGACFLLMLGAILFAIHRLLHYANTYLELAEDALVYKVGWVPSKTDTIFWVNIKDVNASTSVAESLLGTGSIILIIALRHEIGMIKIPFLPEHEKILALIRDKVGRYASEARQVTYT